jgi:nitroreductase
MDLELTPDERAALYKVISLRRDIRAFRAGACVPDEVLSRILDAAHRAPSVGYSQPWDFILVRDPVARREIRASFLRCREIEAARFDVERRAQYLAYRLEGIEDSDLNVCVTVDLRPRDHAVLWLAARAEGVGVGWVSIVEPEVLRRVFALPAGVEPIAYLCVGYPVEFRERPLLEETGWRPRRALEDTIRRERF